MEPNESHHQQQQHHLTSHYYHHLHHHHHPTTASAAGGPTAASASSAGGVPSSTNGLLPQPPPPNDGSSLVVYPHSVPSSAVAAPMEPAKRKRGRPRKYGTPEQALAAKKMASSASSSSVRERREQAAAAAAGGSATSVYSGSSRKSQLGSVGKTGQSFIPHIVNVAPGEDVAQKIIMFMQQGKHELCILSASGTISSASLRQPATSGGNISYEGRYEILSLCGSYIRTELGGRTGGLSVCLSSSDGQIIGGGVGGPLKAAGPVQVILGTFQLDRKKDLSSGVKGDISSSSGRLASPVGSASMFGVGFRSPMESPGRNPMRGNDEHHQTVMGGGHFMIHAPQGIHMTHSRPSEWGSSGHDGRSSVVYDLSGRSGHQLSENGGYEQMPD